MTPKLKRPTDWRNRFGGILAYMAQVPKEESLFEGGCCVFDCRGVVGRIKREPRPYPLALTIDNVQ